MSPTEMPGEGAGLDESRLMETDGHHLSPSLGDGDGDGSIRGAESSNTNEMFLASTEHRHSDDHGWPMDWGYQLQP